MSNKQALVMAVGTHGLWKTRLREAVSTGKLDVSVSEVSAEGKCAFGKWLLDPATSQDLVSSHGQTVRRLHAEFHKIAGNIAQLAISGKKREADNLLVENGEFANASARLTRAMMAWRDSL